MSRVVVYPGELSGSVQLPGDKSVSQRVAILARWHVERRR